MLACKCFTGLATRPSNEKKSRTESCDFRMEGGMWELEQRNNP